MGKQMNLLQIIGTLNPTYGGPVEVLKQLTTSLCDLGHNIEIATLDEDASYGVGQFSAAIHALGPCIGKYRYNQNVIPWLINNTNRFDAVIVHGIWQYQSFATWVTHKKLKVPYFVFVHGALDPWFKQAYPLKHIKKWLYWSCAEYRILSDANGVLFTNRAEASLASKSFRLNKTNNLIINFGIYDRPGNPEIQKELFFEKFPSLREKHIILFLGRIHRKKGCDMLIDAFAKVKNRDPRLHLLIVGPDEENSISTMKSQVNQLCIDEQVTFTGMLEGDLKWGAFHASDVFILPSHSENFGVSVAEALSCSLPVLITDKVNIWQEIANSNAAIVNTDTTDGTICLLQDWLNLPKEEQQKMKDNARNCFLSQFDIRINAEKFASVIQRYSRFN